MSDSRQGLAHLVGDGGGHGVKGRDPRNMSELGLRLAQRHLGQHAFCYVANGANKIQVTDIYRSANGVDVFNSAVRHQQAMFTLEILPFLSRSVEKLLNTISVVRVHPL